MNAELDRNRVAELLPLYVLGALEADEMAAVEAALPDYPDLLERLALLEEVVVHLVESTSGAPLPGDVRTRLLTQVQTDIAPAPIEAGASSTAGNVAPRSRTGHQNPLLRRGEDGAAKPPPAEAVPGKTPARFPWAARLGWVAASLLLALALLGLNFFQQGRIRELRREVVRLTAEVTGLRTVNQQIEQQLQERTNQLALFMDAERSVALAGTALAPTAEGAFYLSGDEGIVVLNGLEPLPADRAYQLWLVPPDGVPTSVALLAVSSSNLVLQTIKVPSLLRNFAIVDVSIEQAGGSPTITKEAIVLRGVIN